MTTSFLVDRQGTFVQGWARALGEREGRVTKNLSNIEDMLRVPILVEPTLYCFTFRVDAQAIDWCAKWRHALPVSRER
jgi:hypothetical protein